MPDTHPIIIDAGPALNFFATNNQRTLFHVFGKLMAPEVVRDEVLRKAGQKAHLASAVRVLARLPAHRMQILSDDPTRDLEDAALRVMGLAVATVQTQSKDLGETTVLIHADAFAHAGRDVHVIIDDRDGRDRAISTIRRLERHRANGQIGLGRITLVGTEDILMEAARRGQIADRNAMRKTYEQMRRCDDGLRHIDQTGLLDKSLWTTRP